MSRSRGQRPVVRSDARGASQDRRPGRRGFGTRIVAVALAALLGCLGGVVAYLLLQAL